MRTLAVFLAFFFVSPSLAAPKVIASVVPVHAIVSAVMGDTGEPELLLSGKTAEHRSTFTASQIAGLGRAELVFFVGQGIETKLAQISGSEAVNGKDFVALSEASGITKLPIREGGEFEHHQHAPDGDDPEDLAGNDHDEGVLTFDPHVWLDPNNAKAMAVRVAQELIKVDPRNAAIYNNNAEAFMVSVDELATVIAVELAPVKDRPYVVFHDAYQYFEHRFGLNAVGSITDVSARTPSADRLKIIRDKLKETRAVCVFREPQYDDRVVTAVIEGSNTRAGVLDPLGAGITPGPGAYQQLMKGLADDLRTCLTD